MNLRMAAATMAVGVLLAACGAAPVRPDLGPAERAAAEAAQAEREQRLRAAGEWGLVGRMAVSTDGRGGSGRLTWQQRAPHEFEVELSAPVTRQSWRLSSSPRGALLEGLEGGPRSGIDPALLLQEATGWMIPVGALSDWVRGARAPGMGPARVEFNHEGRPLRIEQGGWEIEYRWPDADPAQSAAGDLLPERLDARSGGARVKLVVDEWL